MGATLIDENMRAVFVLFTIAFIAAAFAATHEEIHSEATELISDMKKKGATEADCKDLAKTTCKEVVDEQIKDQKVINSQSNGSECDRLGVKQVTYTVKHYHKRVKQWTTSKKTITKWANHRINLGTKSFISLKAGKCGFIFASRSYRTIYARYHRAVKYERTVRGWVIEAKKAIVIAKRSQKNQQEKCRCAVVKRRDTIWRTINNSKKRARQLKALQKCKMMQCVLSGTPTSSSKCKAVLKKLRNKRLSSRTEHAHSSKICHRRHKENKAKGERKSKEHAAKRAKKERAAKERKNKAVAKERSIKRRREQAAKAKAREQHAKAHERRSKAAERASKERSGKLERANKHKAMLARRIAYRGQSWHGYINNWDGGMQWRVGGHHYVSGLLSHHNNHREDRRFRPLVTSIGTSQHGRHITGFVNNMDETFAYTCPTNKAIVGFYSYHNNGNEDRRWRFYCAHFHGVGFRAGGWPGWQTRWDAHFAIGCGHNPAIGFSSYHNNHKEDRIWRIRCGHRYALRV